VKRCSTLVCLLVATCARFARAAECTGDKPWVEAISSLPPAFTEAVRSDLRAGLAPSSIEVCRERPANGPDALASVSIEPARPGTARYTLQVTDSVTQKRVSRELSLENLPPDGRPFALAVAAEELLRASWAELALRGVHSPPTAAPPEVRAIVADAERRREPSARFVALGARVAFERFTGGQTHYGGDLFGVLPLGRRVGGVVALGARRSLPVRAPHGEIEASAFAAELGLAVALYQRGGLELSAFVSQRLLRLTFDAEPSPGATARTRTGLVAISRLGLALAWGRPALLRLHSALGAGLPLHAFSAADADRTVTGASELELFASLGLALELP